ncbi:MFS general substrate transporter [Xylariaceae sp. AK1471]|nr:MFS general substrate transporter [Xylariaceae sp. AK1471]
MDDEDRPSIDALHPDTPLLGRGTGASGQFREPFKAWHIATTPRAVSAVTCIAIFLWVLSGMIVMVPGARLAEDILCRRYYGRKDDDPIDEELCKADEIQSSMAWLFGLTMALGGIVGLVAVLPYGVLADRARKPVYLLAAAGQFANIAWTLLILRFWRTFPIEMILLAPALELLGGGLTMAIVLLYAIISDVNAPENRAITYFFSSLAANAAVFVGPPLASKLIEVWSPWVPMSLSLVATAAAGGIILIIPETTNNSKRPSEADDSNLHGGKEQGLIGAIKSKISRVFYNSDLRSVLKKRSVILLLLTFMFAAPLPMGMGPMFLQYYSKRFKTSIEDGGYMLAIRGGLTIVVVGVLLPALSKYMSSSSCIRLPSFRRDLVLAQASAAFAGLGYLLLGGPDIAFLISGIIILTLSAGLGPLCRSLISNLVEPDKTSQLFTVVTIAEGVGSLPAGPFLAWAFSSGLRLGGLWYGLPFFILGGLGLLALVMLCLTDTDRSTVSLCPASGYDCAEENSGTDTHLHGR